jgi:protein TonB
VKKLIVAVWRFRVKQFVNNHGLFVVLLTASLLGHVSVRWLGPAIAFEPQHAQLESGRNSVSVQLIAMAPRQHDAVDFEPPPPVPLDESDLIETPTPPIETEFPGLEHPTHQDSPVITMEESLVIEAPLRHELASPQLARHERPDSPAVASDDGRRPWRRTEPTRVVSGQAEAEVPKTVLSEQSSGANVPPSFVSRPLPRYPADLLLQGIEGTTHLLVTIGRDGRVLDARLYRSSGYDAMDRSALEAVRRWTFTPARRGNTPIVKRVIVPINFRIRR